MEQINTLKSSIWRVFEIFVEEPMKIHFIKEISRKIYLAPTSVKKHIQNLLEEKLIIKKMGERFYGYIANRDNPNFLFYKKIFNFIKIKEVKLIEFITDSIHPKAIVLYGSYAKGEDIKESDIDLLIISKVNKNLNLNKFEKILKRKIHIIIVKNLNKLTNNLKLEVINGIVLRGYLKNE